MGLASDGTLGGTQVDRRDYVKHRLEQRQFRLAMGQSAVHDEEVGTARY
jgi:hypothetical protein